LDNEETTDLASMVIQANKFGILMTALIDVLT
jgi:hypothetical protein